MESKTPEGLTPEGPAQRRMTPVWDPEQYVRFGDHRDRPFFDLTARIGAQQPRLVVDLGCGPGTLTASLALRWPGAQVVGVDSSVQMIQAAQRICHAPDAPKNLSFALGDIAGWRPEPDTDVLVSNAALQWVPGHQTLLAAWLRPILAALGEADAAEFEETYAALLAGAYPTTARGIIFPFRRIFAVAQKRAAEWEPADRRVAKTSVQQTLAQTRGQR